MTTELVSVRPVRTSRRRALARAIAVRVGTSLIVLISAATLTFLAQTLLPGDRATLLLNQQSGQTIERTADELAPINEKFGFDDPLAVQYAEFLRGIADGTFGTSYQTFQPVSTVITEQLAPTLALTASALVLAWIMAVVGTVLTAGRGRVIRGIGAGLETFAAGLPHYWLGVILLVVFALGLRWFPVVGGTGLAGLVLPAFTMAIPLAGFLGQSMRVEFETALEQPFVLSARMRGMGDTAVRLRHVLRHAALPGITLSGWAIGSLISGAVIVETIFARPGLGRVLVTAVNFRDIPVVAGIVVLIAAVYLLANLAVDIAYTLVDPRLKTS